MFLSLPPLVCFTFLYFTSDVVLLKKNLSVCFTGTSHQWLRIPAKCCSQVLCLLCLSPYVIFLHFHCYCSHLHVQKSCLQARLFCYTALDAILIQCYTVLDAILMQCLKLCLLVKPVIKDFIIIYSFFQIGNWIPFLLVIQMF